MSVFDDFNTNMTALGNEIRELGETTGTKTVPQMTTIVSDANDTIDTQTTLIDQIQTALAGKGTGGIVPSGSISITENGSYNVTQYANADVNVSGITPTGNKEITATTSAQTDIDVTNYATVSVNPTPSETKSTTTNGTVTPTSGKLLSSVTVNVPTGTARTSSDLTVSGATVTVPAGLYSTQATKSVATGVLGTVSATKGTVSNNSVSVTPSISAGTAGYNEMAAKSGTAVTVSASELVSGDKTIIQQTNTDVTNYATARVRPAEVRFNSIDINSSGLITASLNSDVFDSGWIESLPSNKTLQLTTQAAKTVTPSTSAQTAVASGVYTTGAVTVAAIPNQKSDSGNVTLNASTTSKSYAAGYYANAHGAQISTETKSVTSNGTVTPSSGKVLTSVSVNVPLPSGAKWYGFRSWTSASIGANLALKNETWTNNQGTTGISVGDNIILEVTNTNNNKVYAFLINVTSMSGTTAIGDAFACVEIGNTIAPVNPITTYDGSVT